MTDTAKAIIDVLRELSLDDGNALYYCYNLDPDCSAPLDVAVSKWRTAGMPPLGGGEKHEKTIEGLRTECRVYRETIRGLLEKNEALKNPPADWRTPYQQEQVAEAGGVIPIEDPPIKARPSHGGRSPGDNCGCGGALSLSDGVLDCDGCPAAYREDGSHWCPKCETWPERWTGGTDSDPRPDCVNCMAPQPGWPIDPLTEDERARLNYLTEEQRKNELHNHAMGVPDLRELIALRDRAGIS